MLKFRSHTLLQTRAGEEEDEDEDEEEEEEDEEEEAPHPNHIIRPSRSPVTISYYAGATL